MNKDDLIKPVDTDISLCTCYFKAVASRTVPKNTILYDVAVVNVRSFNTVLERQKREHLANGLHYPDDEI